MNGADFVELARSEWKKGSFLPLLCGMTGCEEPLTRRLPAAVPTDWSYVLEQGVYALYRQERDPSIPALCRRDVERLLAAEDPFSVWCGYSVCFFLICKERDGRAPFRIMDGALLDRLRRALAGSRDALARARIWQGADAAEGLWSDIEDSAQVLKEKFGVCLLPETSGDGEPDGAGRPLLRGGAGQDMAALLGRKLEEYVEAQRREKHRLPRAVRLEGMDVPRVDAPYGSFGDWLPQRATTAVSRRELEELYGFEIGVELYEYYRSWRFAGFELHTAGLDLYMDPVYETAEGKTSFFQSVRLNGAYYFKLGTASDPDSGAEYTLLCRNTGGLYLLDDEAQPALPQYFAESITALLNYAG